jgi:hypothetical protein
MHGGLPTNALPMSPCPGQATLRSRPDSQPERIFMPVVCSECESARRGEAEGEDAQAEGSAKAAAKRSAVLAAAKPAVQRAEP